MDAAAEKDDWITAPAPAAEKDDWITAPAAKAERWAVPEGGEFGDLNAQASAPARKPGALERIAGAGVKGAVEGFGDPIGSTILSPEAQAWMDDKQRKGGVGGFLAGLGSTAAQDIGTVGGVIAGAGNALFRGAQGAVAQTGAELGAPQLGRDIAAIPEAFMGSPGELAHSGAPVADRPFITARQVQARDGVGIMEAWNRAHTENTARASTAIADIGKATDIDGAIAAAGKAAETPGGAAAGMDDLFAPKDATTGNPGIYGGQPDVTKGPFDFGAPSQAPVSPTGWSDAFTRQPVGEEEAGRSAAIGDQAEASAAPSEAAVLPTTTGTATPYQALPKEPKRLIQFLREPTTNGTGIYATVTPGGLQDVGGDVAAAIGGPRGRPGLINNKSGRSLDDATLAAWQAGYFPEHDQRPEINDLLNAIRDDHTGTARYSTYDQTAADAHQYAQAHNDEIDRIASQIGLDTSGMTRDQFFDAVSDHLSASEHAAAQAASDAEHQDWFDKALASAKNDGADYGTTAPRSLAELEDEYRQEEAARTTLNSHANGQGSGYVAANAGAGQAGGGYGGSVAGPAGRSGAQAGITATQIQRRDGVGYNEAVRRAAAENAAAPQSVGAAASREQTHPSQIQMDPAEFAANRVQGETERLAAPPTQNDRTIYIPGTKPTLAEVTGDPTAAMDQAYNRQQPEAMTRHLEQENHNADAVANYYADTAGSAQDLLRMERARDTLAARNIQNVFGDPHASRPPADPSPTINLMQGILENPRQAERNSVVKILSSLADKFYDDAGNLKTDPYALYGIGEHINDLLRGAGDTETNSAARVLKRELVQIKDSLYNDIEDAAPGFAQYRADYQRDSRAIDAMKLLQDERLSLLSGVHQHITPAKWFTFMRGIVEGRADPMDAAAALSEDQMDRLWNITNQLKRSTFIDAGKPRGSWTSMMQEWGGRFGRLAAHGIAASTFPVVGNLGVEMGVAGLRKRSVSREMQRVLNPDLGQQPGP